MREAGFVFPESFEDREEIEPPLIPMDSKWTQELGLVQTHLDHLRRAWAGVVVCWYEDLGGVQEEYWSWWCCVVVVVQEAYVFI